MGSMKKAIRYLRKSLEYAKAADDSDRENTVYRFTAPFLNQLEYNPDSFWRTGGTKYVENFYKAIKCSPFDKLHDRGDFQKYFK